MPVADLLVDDVAGHNILNFMDGYFSYNYIYRAEEGVHKTTFRCLGSIGTFEWIIMPFDLKNVRATYQRAMDAIFHDMTSHFIEIYIDDVLDKSNAHDGHILWKVVQRMRVHQLKINPLNCPLVCWP